MNWQLEIPIQNEARFTTSVLRLQFILVSGEDGKRERKRTTPCSRRIRKLNILFLCCSIGVLLPIFTLSAATYKNIPRSLQRTIDSPLEAHFEQYIKRQRSRKILATTDRTTFVVYDITKNRKLVSINESRQTMAASLIKNFVMLAYFHEVRYGRQIHTAANKGNLRAMIQRSSNPSTNYFIRLLGGPARVNRILQAQLSLF